MGKGSNTTTQKSDPWEGVQPYLNGSGGIYPEAQRIYQQTSGQSAPQQQVADMNQMQMGGLNAAANTGAGFNMIANNLGDPVSNLGLGMLSGGSSMASRPNQTAGSYSQQPISGGFGTTGNLTSSYNDALKSLMAGGTNPYLEQMGQAATRGLENQFSRTVMPGINSEAIGNGQMGSSRQGIAQGLAAQGLQSATGDALANLYGNAYNTNQANMLNASLGARNQDTSLENARIGAQASKANALASTENARMNYDLGMRQLGLQSLNALGGLQNLGLTGAGAVTGAGNAYQGQRQAELNTGYNNQVNSQQYPWQQLNNYASIVSPGAGIGGTTQTQQPTNYGAGALGGALAGSQIGSLIPAIGGGWGAGAGALLGLLSDRRFKTDIEAVGKMDNGLTVYRYRYKSGGPKMLGVMADEVKAINPNAVMNVDGVDYVNYGAI